MSSTLSMDAEEYLDRFGVTAYLKDVVTLLLENRPENPIAFTSQYFRTVTQGSSPLLRAYRYIRLASPEQQEAFVDNLVAAYQTLDARRGVSGVTGAEMLRLLRLVTSDCPIDISRSLLILLDRTESDPIGFAEFSAAVHAAMHYEAFFARAAKLFAECDPSGSGRVPRSIVDLAVRQVRCREGPAAAAAALASSTNSAETSETASVRADAAARLDQQRLQRDVQCEVAKLLGPSSSPNGSPSKPPPAAAAAAARPGPSGSSGSSGSTPASAAGADLEEMLRCLFAASLGNQPAATAALEAAAVASRDAAADARVAAGAAALFRGTAG